jgi:hypothetical protein
VLQLVTLVVALVFGVWFGQAAARAGLGVLELAIGGAVLGAVASIALPVSALLIVRSVAGDISGTATFVIGSAFWVVGIVVAIALGSRFLPEPTQDHLRVMLEAQRAKSERAADPSAESLRCVKCGSAVAKKDVLRVGAIRVNDTTCVCPSCKGAAR